MTESDAQTPTEPEETARRLDKVEPVKAATQVQGANPGAAIAEAARVLRPGGTVFAFDPNLRHPALPRTASRGYMCLIYALKGLDI